MRREAGGRRLAGEKDHEPEPTSLAGNEAFSGRRRLAKKKLAYCLASILI